MLVEDQFDEWGLSMWNELTADQLSELINSYTKKLEVAEWPAEKAFFSNAIALLRVQRAERMLKNCT